jgi:hypothetical protein
MQQVETRNTNFDAPPEVARWQMISLVIGLIGIVGGIIGYFVSPNQFFHAYLIGYILWTGCTLGCLGWLMIQFAAGGAWGVPIRRQLEAATRLVPLMFVLFVPIIFGRQYLYEWTRPEAAQNPTLVLKSGYLNVPFWIGRFVFFFAVWFALQFFINRWSRGQDATGDIRYAARLKALSGIGLLLFALTVSFASFDWIMSIAPEWYSTIFGLLTMVSWGLTAMAFIIILSAALIKRPPLDELLGKPHFHDYGKLLLAFVMLWAYLSLSQFLIIWSGNLPEEITWYVTRLNHGWQYVGLLLVFFQFALPFLLLLLRDLKRNVRKLTAVAALLFFMRAVDIYWIVEPQMRAGERGTFHFDAMSLLLPLALCVGIGGVWLFFFFWQLRSMPLVPLGDPILDKAYERAHSHH